MTGGQDKDISSVWTEKTAEGTSAVFVECKILQTEQALCVERHDLFDFGIGDKRIVDNAADIHRGIAGRVIGAEKESVRAEKIDRVAEHTVTEQAVAGKIEVVILA